jgi:hypothetical protein
MGAAVPLREDFSALDLRLLARQAQDAAQARRESAALFARGRHPKTFTLPDSHVAPVHLHHVRGPDS